MAFPAQKSRNPPMSSPPNPDPLGSPDSDNDSIEDYSPEPTTAQVERYYTQQDAQSLVGGEEVSLNEKDVHTDADDTLTTSPKVFSFSLPFGGLSSIRSNFKLPFAKHDEDPEVKNLRLRLERQESVNTVQEAKLFASVRGTDDVRLRAMRHSIKENISELLPEFIVKKEKSSIYSELTGPVVVMGGYRGSILRDAATGKRVWIPLKAGLNLRKINLLLGPSPEDEIRATDLIYPDGVLKNIGPFDICKRFIKRLDNGKTTVKEFGYDWRLSLHIPAGQLIECLEKLRKKTGQRVIVVAHSMGGLVAHAAMQQRPDLFRGLIYVGVPSECLNILGPVRYGDSVMFSDKILTFETNFMMRSSYAFLPLSGRVFANKTTGEHYDLDYFNPDTWVEYNLNPLVSSTRKAYEEEHNTTMGYIDTVVSPSEPPQAEEPLSSSSTAIGTITSKIKLIPTGINRKSKPAMFTNSQMQKRHKLGRASSPLSPVKDAYESKFSFSFTEAYNYLSDTLKSAKEFVLGLEYKPELEHKYPPMAVVYGDKVPSVRGSHVTGPQDIKDGNYYEFFYGRGDGVVHQKWLMPENKGFVMHDAKKGTGHIVGKFSTDAGHVNLMTDLDVMAEALAAIVDADKKWKRE